MKGCMKVITVLVGLGIVGCIGLVALYVLGSNLVQDEALEANAGRGTLDNPIPAGEAVMFSEFEVRIGQITRPATADVERMNMFNEAPAAGTDYVIIAFDVVCLKPEAIVCRGHELKARIVDASGNEWGEPTIIMIDDPLDSREAIGGALMYGNKAFEFPTNGTMTALKLWTTGGATLYIEV